MNKLYFLIVLLSFSFLSRAQITTSSPQRSCATIEVLKEKMKDDGFRTRFQANQNKLHLNVEASAKSSSVQQTIDTIPVVVHIILANPAMVTDAICQSQIDVLNDDFKGLNADSSRIPAAFKSLFGKGNLHFALAKTDPDGLPTNGIVRKSSNQNFSVSTEANAKYSNRGGLDGWDPERYFNVWVVKFNDGTLGISVFPGDPSPLAEHGYLCDYRCWGKNTSYGFTEYNLGRTATHEIGHFFNLFHIWGDDNGSCAGSDFYGTTLWDDTPNQSDATYGNPDTFGVGKVVFDNCSKTGAGIMYQNYMDYSSDSALVMFTKGQWKRINQALTGSPDRVNLVKSTTYNPPPSFSFNAGIPSVKNNGQYLNSSNIVNVCGNSDFAPSVKLINYGTTPLTSVNIHALVNNTPVFLTTWTGNLLQYDSVFVPITGLVLVGINNTVSFYTALPNGNADGYTANDSSKVFQVDVDATPFAYLPVSSGFEVISGAFPPADWSIKNSDNKIGWTRATNAGRTGTSSAFINLYAYNNSEGQVDYLSLPKVNASLASNDSLILTFFYAYRQYANGYNDKLEVVVSTDCGDTWTAVWSKAGAALATASGYTTSSFKPTANQWSFAKIILSQYLGQDVIFAFRSTSDWGQNIYIDDVNLSSIAKTTMPVELISFTGSVVSKSQNLLSWTTASEINTNYFSVERSSGGADFLAIAKVAAKGESATHTTYSYVDETAALTGYYRLNMVDKDGKNKYSNVVVIKKEDAVFNAAIFPNPAKETVTVRFTSLPFLKTSVQIADMQGRIVYKSSMETKSSSSNIPLDIAALAKGIYIMKLEVGGFSQQFKLIKE